MSWLLSLPALLVVAMAFAVGPFSTDSAELDRSLEIYCIDDPAMAVADTNRSGLITKDELEEWSWVVADGTPLIIDMDAYGYDAIQYAGCTP